MSSYISQPILDAYSSMSVSVINFLMPWLLRFWTCWTASVVLMASDRLECFLRLTANNWFSARGPQIVFDLKQEGVLHFQEVISESLWLVSTVKITAYLFISCIILEAAMLMSMLRFGACRVTLCQVSSVHSSLKVCSEIPGAPCKENIILFVFIKLIKLTFFSLHEWKHST